MGLERARELRGGLPRDEVVEAQDRRVLERGDGAHLGGVVAVGAERDERLGGALLQQRRLALRALGEDRRAARRRHSTTL